MSARPPADAGALPPFERARLAGDVLAAAHALLGARLVRAEPGTLRIGRIVEVEAYDGEDDAASHARFGRTRRNAAMFGEPGRAYVYLVYGMHHCLNVVAGSSGRAAAVLVRAVEPLVGLDAMLAARAAASRGAARRPVPDARVAAGPGLVGDAFGVSRGLDGVDLCDPRSPLRLAAAAPDTGPVHTANGPRVGVAYAAEPWRSLPWRLWDPASPSVSGRRR